MEWKLEPRKEGIYWFYGKKYKGQPEKMVMIRVQSHIAYSIKAGGFYSYIDEMIGKWLEIKEPQRPE